MSSKICGEPHPTEPGRTCVSRGDTHGDHVDAKGPWPRPERIAKVQEAIAARKAAKKTPRSTRLKLLKDARESKRAIIAGDIGPGIPSEAEGKWVQDEWITYAGRIFEDFLKSRETDFTTAEDVWPLLDRPEEMRALSVLVRDFLRVDYIEEVASKRLRGTYRTKDGFEFAENKLVPIYRSKISRPRPMWGTA